VESNTTDAKLSSEKTILVFALICRQRLRSLYERCMMGGDRDFSLNDKISRCTTNHCGIRRHRYWT